MNFFFKKIQFELRFRRGPWMDYSCRVQSLFEFSINHAQFPRVFLYRQRWGCVAFKRRLLSHDSQIQLRKVVIKYQEFQGLDELENSKDKNKLWAFD